MDFGFFNVFIIAAILAVQFFFSTRNHAYLGAVLPIVYFVLLTWSYLSNRMESFLGYILYLLLGLFFLIAEWRGGRKYLLEKREKELEKMKTLDL